jgi:hypothetical protein
VTTMTFPCAFMVWVSSEGRQLTRLDAFPSLHNLSQANPCG